MLPQHFRAQPAAAGLAGLLQAELGWNVKLGMHREKEGLQAQISRLEEDAAALRRDAAEVAARRKTAEAEAARELAAARREAARRGEAAAVAEESAAQASRLP